MAGIDELQKRLNVRHGGDCGGGLGDDQIGNSRQHCGPPITV
jgi:hypothetical protein